MARYERIAEAIRKEVSTIIHDELKDPRLGFITIVRVELTHDLQSARIFYSVLGSDKERENSRMALDSALGFIRRLIGQRIMLRIVPELMFKEDRSIEYSVRIEEILQEIKTTDEPKKRSRVRKKK
jgi:ribosome-binding factor A